MTKKDAHNVGLNFSNSDTANHVVKTLGETFKQPHRLGIQEETMRQAEILNGLEAIVELLYEVDAHDKEYYAQVIGQSMDYIMEVDQ